MKIKIALLTAACALALTACGDKSPAPTDTAAPDTTTSEAAPPAAPAVEEAAPAAPEAPSLASDKPAAVVANCATEFEGTDAMQYSIGSIVIPASCTTFKITLKHSGHMPKMAMGHNVVIALASDIHGVDADGIGAGIAANYVKADDSRVIAHTDLIGGGETTSVSFDVSKLKAGVGPYALFCSFPGHSALMKGEISVAAVGS